MTTDSIKPTVKIETAVAVDDVPEGIANQSSTTLSTSETTEAVLLDASDVQVKSDPAKSSEVALPIDKAPASVSFSPTSKEEKKDDQKVDEEEEEPTSLEEVYEALGSLSSPGSTCTGGVATELPPIPGLVVEGVGDISLPLGPECAEKLKAVANQAPHGRGMETVIDTAVRNTLQVDADKVSLSNPAWSTALTTLTRKVSVALGVNADLVRPELYKLLLYETGGFFKKHRDTEKAEGMFATLVIQLPSRFSGGSFVVSHNGKSETFSLADPKTAPFNCHFVGHYADCEHEILPVESGCRLALIYSLCYTGNEVSKPSLADLEEGSLVSVMKQLNPAESLFAVPMDHQYTSLSLARFGVGALKGDDRALAQTISRVDGWEMVLATAQRTDFESGDGGGYYCDFEVYDTERGDVELTELFHQDGGDAEAHRPWLRKELDFDCIAEGGKILADEEECKEMWGEGDSGEVEYTGNEGANRETTYTTCFLVAFSNEGVFERLCQANFSGAVAETQRNPTLIDRLLKYIKTSKQDISPENFLKLHQLIAGQDFYWESFHVIFQGFSKSKNAPTSGVFSILTSLIKELGWDHEKILTIRLFLEQLPKSVELLEISNLMPLIEGLLAIKIALEDKSPVAKLLQTTATHVGDVPTSTSSTSYYRYSNRLSIVEVCERLKYLSSQYGWADVRIFVRPFFVRVRKLNSKKSVDALADQLAALASISADVPSTDVHFIRQAIVDDFVGLVEAKLNSSQSSTFHRQSSASNAVWKSSKIDIVVRELILHGTPALFQRIQAWASKASLSNLSDADSVLQKFKSTTNQSVHAPAKDQLVDHIRRRCCELKVAELKKQENKLLGKTQGGQPVFSWSMPNARTGDSALNAFLHGSQKGPSEIRVGGGINGARQLASGRRYGSYGYSITAKELIHKGYSAEICNTNKTGRNASVLVTKTKQLHKAQVNQYNLNIKALADVRAQLEKLGHRPSQPAQLPAAKRAKSDPEVIVID